MISSRFPFKAVISAFLALVFVFASCFASLQAENDATDPEASDVSQSSPFSIAHKTAFLILLFSNSFDIFS